MEHRPKILSIDDNDANQKLVERALAPDYEVQTAMSGSSGIEALVTFQPDIILLDVDMPRLDGLRLCRMIRAEPAFATTPVLFVSGHDSREDRARGFQAGGDDYICKPINIEQLKQKLQFSLSRPSHAAQQASNDTMALEHNIQTLHDCLLSLLDSSQNPQELGRLALHTLEKMGLCGAVYLHASGETFSSIGALTDLETLLLQQATRPYPSEYSARYLWGSEHLGAIIQNMPFVRHEQYQPLLQIISTLFSAVNRRIAAALSNRAAPRPTATHPTQDYNQLQTHGYRLEYALETLERQSETLLTDVCQTLQTLQIKLDNPHQRQTVKNLFDNCMQLRLAIYDQCLEVQAQHAHIMKSVGVPALED